MKIRIQVWPGSDRPGITAPAYAGDAGMDLLAIETTEVPAHGYVDIPHGFAIEIPTGYFGYIGYRI